MLSLTRCQATSGLAVRQGKYLFGGLGVGPALIVRSPITKVDGLGKDADTLKACDVAVALRMFIMADMRPCVSMGFRMSAGISCTWRHHVCPFRFIEDSCSQSSLP